MQPPRTIGLVLTLALICIIAACSGAAPAATTPAGPTQAVDEAHVIALDLTADLKIEQDGQQVSTLPVTQGETYTFKITNTAGFEHDFFIGSDSELSAGAAGLPGIPGWSDGTREFQYTFDSADPLAFGCTIPGHYALMKGVFDIQP